MRIHYIKWGNGQEIIRKGKRIEMVTLAHLVQTSASTAKKQAEALFTKKD